MTNNFNYANGLAMFINFAYAYGLAILSYFDKEKRGGCIARSRCITRGRCIELGTCIARGAYMTTPNKKEELITPPKSTYIVLFLRLLA